MKVNGAPGLSSRRQLGKKYLSGLTRQRELPSDFARDDLLLRRRRRLEAENRFAFFHQIETITRDRFQIHSVACEQMHFPGLAREQNFLLIHLALQVINFGLALRALFVERKKQARNHQNDGEPEEHAQNAVQPLPDCGFTPRAEIAIA